MARVTVEDCIENIPSRFELVVQAAQRAKQIESGMPLTIDRDNDKDAVVALREIADQTIDLEQLSQETVQSFCRRQSAEDFVAAPFAGEIEDEMSAQAQEVQASLEDESEVVATEAQIEAPEGMSFADDDVVVED